MGYNRALEAAGAIVIDTKYIGDYQGSWGSIVIYNGIKCLVIGGYGSCSGCDAFQAEFDGGQEPHQNDGKYYTGRWGDEEISKEEYDILADAYNKRLSDFAQSYLTTPFYIKDVIAQLDSYKGKDDWYAEDKELYEWAIQYLIAELRDDNINSILED